MFEFLTHSFSNLALLCLLGLRHLSLSNCEPLEDKLSLCFPNLQRLSLNLVDKFPIIFFARAAFPSLQSIAIRQVNSYAQPAHFCKDFESTLEGLALDFPSAKFDWTSFSALKVVSIPTIDRWFEDSAPLVTKLVSKLPSTIKVIHFPYSIKSKFSPLRTHPNLLSNLDYIIVQFCS